MRFCSILPVHHLAVKVMLVIFTVWATTNQPLKRVGRKHLVLYATCLLLEEACSDCTTMCALESDDTQTMFDCFVVLVINFAAGSHTSADGDSTHEGEAGGNTTCFTRAPCSDH